jgi:hypothetical protein
MTMLLVLAAAGAALAAGVARLAPARYRAMARVLVVEPRLGTGVSVDFNLTPVRSYAALLTSPTLLAGCSGGALADRLRVRLPENTRVLEVSLEDASPARAAELVNCATTRAIEENRRLNTELAARSATVVDEALERSRTAIAGLEGELAAARRSSRLEVARGELKTALDDASESADEERRARVKVADAAARRKSFAETARTSDGRDGAARELAERGAAEAAADEAAGRAALAAAGEERARADARAAALESKTAGDEAALASLNRRLEAAASARAELERRRASAPLEAAAKAFELAVLSPAVPASSPTRVPAGLASVAGAVCALVVGVLFVLSRD